MSAIDTSVLIGVVVLTSSATIVVDGANNAVIAAGTYYLRDATAANSLLDVILAAVTPHMTTPAIFVAQDRKIRVTAGASFTWTIPATLQAALGFGASIPSTSSATATYVSNLLWAAGWPETPIGHPVGTTGYRVPNRVQTSSYSGLTVRTTVHGTAAKLTTLKWSKVPQARVWTTSELGGEFRRFLDDVVEDGLQWKLYSGVTEDSTSSTAITWPTAQGPYKDRDYDPAWYNRSISSVDRFSDPEIKGAVTSEIA